MNQQPPKERDLSQYKIPIKALILNHEKYDKETYGEKTPGDRKGSRQDVEMLKDTLEDFGDNVKQHIEIKHDLTVTEIEEKIKSYAEAVDFDPADLGCLMIVVLTHGMSGGILLAQDKMYNNCQIWDPIVNSKLLEGVPKFVVFQACRSSSSSNRERRIDTTDQEDDELSEDDGSPNVLYTTKYLPNAEDVIVSYSTVENKVAVRSDVGTWYIRLLSQHLREWNQRGLLDILTKVTENLINNHGISAAEITVGQDVSITSKTGEPQIKQTQEKNYNIYYSQTATFVSYLKQDIKLSYTPKSTPVNFPSEPCNKTSELETDASDGKVLQVDTLTQYCNTNNFQGIFYIFHDTTHLNEAQELGAVAEILKLFPIIKEENSKTSCYEYLAKESKRTDFKDDDILFVAYLGHFDELLHFTEEKLKFERSYKTRACPALAGKPKVFIFLDVHEIAIASKEEHDGERQNQYATDSSDFLFIRSSGKVYKTILFEQLRLAIGKDLLGILTECTRLYKEQPENKPKVKPHFESTLTRAIYLATKTQVHTQEEREKKQSIPSYGVKDESKHHIERTTEHEKILTNLLERSEQSKPLIDVLIHGNQGVGKTQFTYHFMNCKEVQIKFINRLIFDASNEVKFQTTLTDMNQLNGLQISDCTLAGVCSYIDKKCTGKTLIIFDNYNPDMFELEQHAKLADNLYYVAVTRQDIESIQARHKIEITEFSDEQSKKLFKTLLNCDCNEQQTGDLVKIFGKNPLVISLVCDYVNDEIGDEKNKFDIKSSLITPFSPNSNHKITVFKFDLFYTKNIVNYDLDALLGKYFVFKESLEEEDDSADYL